MTITSVQKKLPKISISIRLPIELHERVREISESLSVEADSTLYRWMVESFLAIVESEQDPPSLPPILELARQIEKGKEVKFRK